MVTSCEDVKPEPLHTSTSRLSTHTRARQSPEPEIMTASPDPTPLCHTTMHTLSKLSGIKGYEASAVANK